MLKKKGFTLIELLVVIAIIAILVVLIILALNAARTRARDTSRKSDLRSVQTGLELYNDTNQEYAPGAGAAILNYTALEALLPEVRPWPSEDTGSQIDYGYMLDATGEYGLGTDLENNPAASDCGVASPYDYCVGTNPAGL